MSHFSSAKALVRSHLIEMHAKASLRSRSTTTTTGAGVLESDVVRTLALSLSATPVLGVARMVSGYLGIWASGHLGPASCVLRPATCEMRVDSIYPFVPRGVEYGVTLTLASAIIHLTSYIIPPT